MNALEDHYCDFCRSNRFDNFDKHLRTDGHRSNFEKAMKSQKKKFELARRTLNEPTIAMTIDGSTKFWCYFCCDEFLKHWTSDDGDLAVENGGLVAHFLSEQHRRRIVDVRKLYRRQIDCGEFCFNKNVLNAFIERVERERTKILNKRKDSLRETSSKFRELDRIRAQLVEHVRSEVQQKPGTSSADFLPYDSDDFHPNGEDFLRKHKRALSPTTTNTVVNSRMKKQFKQSIRNK